jgi:glycosyltransferase domain-containing protein
VAAARYSLIVPTYNRPDDLGRLLRLLARHKADFPVLVLDSSSPPNRERNQALAAGLDLELRIEPFPPTMPPFEKFWRGAQMVRTEFASLCADDDLVLADSIAPLVEHLARHRDCSVAHGWYFYFYLAEGALGLTRIAYRGASIDAADPVDRLHQLFRSYEALTYGVYRTPVLQRALAGVQQVETMLARELLGGALAVVAGKADRLPLLYAGRSHGPSVPYAHWHPMDFLLGPPQRLFDEYARCRAQILAYYGECGHSPRDDLVQLVDLAHLRYLAEYYSPEVVDYVFEQTRRGMPRGDILGGIWPVWTKQRGLKGVLQRSRWVRRLRDRFAPSLRGYGLRRFTQAHVYRKLQASSADGVPRTYHVYPEFAAELPGGVRAEDLVEKLGAYA